MSIYERMREELNDKKAKKRSPTFTTYSGNKTRKKVRRQSRPWIGAAHRTRILEGIYKRTYLNGT